MWTRAMAFTVAMCSCTRQSSERFEQTSSTTTSYFWVSARTPQLQRVRCGATLVVRDLELPHVIYGQRAGLVGYCKNRRIGDSSPPKAFLGNSSAHMLCNVIRWLNWWAVDEILEAAVMPIALLHRFSA